MIIRFRILLQTFSTYLLVFILAKIVFVMLNHGNTLYQISNLCDIISHGLPLDSSMAAYLIAPQWLLLLLTLPFAFHTWQKRMLQGWNILASFVCVICLVVDIVLYPFWGFKLDATVFAYLDSPKDALASVSIWFVIAGVLGIIAIALALAWLLNRYLRCPWGKAHSLISSAIGMLLLGGILFLTIRGGVGRSTMNVGRVYYSAEQFYNHAAVNPVFNLMATSLKSDNLSKLHQFFPEAERQQIFEALHYNTQSENVPQLLTTTRPNLLIILMEGMGAGFVEPLGGEHGVTPFINELSQQCVFFSQCFANSFRTDRGTVCALSGYPSFPNHSPMKMPRKSCSLGSIASALKPEGYHTDFFYGGDINFTNMKSYLHANGYDETTGDTDFPLSVRRTHAWGVTDQIAFDSLYARLLRRQTQERWMTTFLTLASHEPWGVPFHREGLSEKANTMAYLDSCLQKFVTRLKNTSLWDNLLIVCIPDHGMAYPDGLSHAQPLRDRIPCLWTGGAIREPRRIDKICNQTDLLATLLGQFHLPHEQFPFSRDILSDTYTYPCAISTYPGGFSFADSTGFSAYDLTQRAPITEQPSASPDRIRRGLTLLQTATQDFARR